MKIIASSVFGFASLAGLLAAGAQAADPASPVTLNWLGGSPPALGGGVSWGVPWPKGVLHLRDPLTLTGADGKEVRLQTWPLAYWPDGSLKWTGQAISASAALAGPFQLGPRPAGPAAAPGSNRAQGRQRSNGERIVWNANGEMIDIDTGPMRCRILKHDTAVVFESVRAGDTVVAENGRLVLLVDDQPLGEDPGTVTTNEYVSRIDKVTLEQGGPVRATIKIEGTHILAKTGRTLLPFVVRLYFYAGQASIRMVHSIVYDADDQKDFVRGLGLEFDVPLREEIQNRHVRLAGDTGMWAEPVKPLMGRRVIESPAGGNVFPTQLAGKPVPPFAAFSAQGQVDINSAADWSDFRLAQLHPDGFTIEKRTHPETSWVHVLDGRRSPGLVFLGDTSGGVAAVMKDFWQKEPAALEVRGATTSKGQIRLWFWSPQAAPMDLRHYDTVAHGLDLAYEDVEPGFSTPYGIGNTSEVTLWALPSVPPNAELVQMAKAANDPQLLVCTPEYYHANRSFGIWSLPDRSTPARAAIEDQLDAGISFYQHEIEQRSWYGFWNYGDLMRMYDETRHEWRYDIGGWAWNNTELMPNLWLWYSFLRTGRADIFRMAAEMTRQTQEVDCYHIGRFAGLGSRHNVSHWGDSAKQPRISNAALKNAYYYLTTDERMGDLLHEVVNADFAAAAVDPLRDVRAASAYPMHSGFGFESTWPAFAINWMTEYERTRDPRWRDKILVGMKTMLEIAPPGQPLSIEGGYDPATGRLYDEGGGTGTLVALFGGPEICFQLMQEIDYPEFWTAWTEMASRGSGRLLAYAAQVRNDPAMGRRVWGGGGTERGGGGGMRAAFSTQLHTVSGPDVPAALQEAPGRPEAAGDGQRMLNIIECLDLAGQYLPAGPLPVQPPG
jgi:hypothetical protein